MRIRYLLTGLIGLFALSFAAPTSGNDASPAAAADVTTDASLELGKVRLCTGRRGQSTCVEVNAHMNCQQLRSPVRYNVQSIVQSRGSLCSYFQDNECNNTAFTVDSGRSEHSVDISLKWSPVLTGLICIPGAKVEATDTMVVTATDSSPLRFQTESHSRFHVRLCTEPNAYGHCLEFPAQFTCFALRAPFRNNLKSWTLSTNIVCEFYTGDSCVLSYRVFGASNFGSKEDWTSNMPSNYSAIITGVHCVDYNRGAAVGALDSREPNMNAPTAPAATPPHTNSVPNTISHSPKRPSPTSPAGDALLCATDISTGPCFKVTATTHCADIVGPVDGNVRTIYQNKGSVCEFHEGDACGARLGTTNSSRHSIIVSVPEQIASRMGSVVCSPSAVRGAASEVGGGVAFDAPFVVDTDVPVN
ncbi:hypothetical protein C7974DRAFT_12516 [Boeremia exigua]|uniref:uncharacterized protein n=1 Tax=Boeremia exigua TaxID=749465 RepID=UPI001E8E89C2|nr:uncharacterized protein C7974DRAFT_12516 [Boeremia exigua]KAH6644003.1 hypothetical protein C7974DRAFT_12516 [Boeremia exigua]